MYNICRHEDGEETQLSGKCMISLHSSMKVYKLGLVWRELQWTSSHSDKYKEQAKTAEGPPS